MREKDLFLNEHGDIEIGFDGDLRCVYDDEVTAETILFRLKTYAGDYELSPICGASLEDFIGEPNTEALGREVEQRVLLALTHDGYLNPDSLTIRVSPLSRTAILIVITVSGKRGNFNTYGSLDLLTGSLEVRSDG